LSVHQSLATSPVFPSSSSPSPLSTSSSFGYTVILSVTFASLTHLFLNQYRWLDLFFDSEDGVDMFLHNVG
jgi:hypothetical protein